MLLAVGAAGGLSRVFDETGMAELLAEHALHPRYGILTPFLAAAIVKTMQGNSLTAVLTASGMVEPMLPALGLDSAIGPRAGCRRGGRGLDGDLPRQRSVLLDRRHHGEALAGTGALRDLAGQRW